MIIKTAFLIISIFIGIFGIVYLNTLPNTFLSSTQNYWRLSIFSNISSFFDIIMFWIIVCSVPEGDYGTGLEVFLFILTIIFYGIPCIMTSFFLKKRMESFNNHSQNINRINGLNLSVIFKAMFMFVETIWLTTK